MGDPPRSEPRGESKMFTTKLNLVAHLALAVLCVATSIEPALAGGATQVPAPLLGAGVSRFCDSSRRILARSQVSRAPLDNETMGDRWRCSQRS